MADQPSKPLSLRRIIRTVRLLERGGLDRKAAIHAAHRIVKSVERPHTHKPANRARTEAALEYLQHRNRTMAGVR